MSNGEIRTPSPPDGLANFHKEDAILQVVATRAMAIRHDIAGKPCYTLGTNDLNRLLKAAYNLGWSKSVDWRTRCKVAAGFRPALKEVETPVNDDEPTAESPKTQADEPDLSLGRPGAAKD